MSFVGVTKRKLNLETGIVIGESNIRNTLNPQQ